MPKTSLEAKHFHLIAFALTSISLLFQIIALASEVAMWSNDPDSDHAHLEDGGCGLFECDKPVVCGCRQYHCNADCPIVDEKKCPTSPVHALCADLAGHMSAAQAFSIVAILFMILAFILALLKITPLKEKLPDSLFGIHQIVYWASAIVLLVTWALVAASFDQEMCGCKVKDYATLNFGFAFLIINFVFMIICAILQGASQGMEGTSGGDFMSYSS
eukprot:Sspe_Gene.70135::Locus_41419_Transcript_1_10_Confidence_0.154_Length_773::g.70135::m.70135